MTRAATIAHRLRWLILILGLLSLGGWFWYFTVGPFTHETMGFHITPAIWGGYPAHLLGFTSEPAYLVSCGLFVLGVMLLMQWLFLRPRRHFTIQLASTSRPMRTAVIAAAFMAMMLTTGLIVTLFEMADWWEPILGQEMRGMYFVWGGMALLWAIWAVVLFIYWRQGDRYTWLGRITRALFAGSIAEMLVATGVFAWNPHNGDCYCARGSYSGLVLGGTVLVWAFGPGIVLLFMRERYRRERLIPVCNRCGYDLRGLGEAGRETCPECGTPFATTGRPAS